MITQSTQSSSIPNSASQSRHFRFGALFFIRVAADVLYDEWGKIANKTNRKYNRIPSCFGLFFMRVFFVVGVGAFLLLIYVCVCVYE